MNCALVDRVVQAVLYEGYLLYPYRASSIKNHHRWNFGVIYPEQESCQGVGPWRLQVELLVNGDSPNLDLDVRFLHLSACVSGEREWQDAVERDVLIHDFDASAELAASHFDFPQESRIEGAVERRMEAMSGHLQAAAAAVAGGLWKVTVQISNITGAPESGSHPALLRSMISTHVVATVRNGEFISLLDPDEQFAAHAAACANSGLWPVMVGEEGARDTMLCSPIILYDYPQVAPESAGDLFDATEIDEILSLRILTLTEEEKRAMRDGDERARRMLERTESLAPEQWEKLHGAIRGLRAVTGDLK